MSIRPLFLKTPNEAIEELNDVFFPPYITLAHLFHAPDKWGIRTRILKQYQLQYVTNGSAVYQIGPMQYETKQGDLLFHRPGEIHQISTAPGAKYVCISIVFHFGHASFPMEDLLPDVHDMGNFLNQPLEKKLSSLVLHYHQPGLGNQMKAQALLMDILSDLHHQQLDQRIQPHPTAVQRSNHAMMVLVKNYIIDHFDKNLQITDLVDLTGYSRDYVTQQFKRTFGMTPIQYLIHVRVEKAKELALHAGLTIGEIAERVGYSDVHTFGKMFKKKTGFSLSQFCSLLFTHAAYKEEDVTLPIP